MAHLYYTEHGAGRPLVMLHGFAADHRLMEGCMEPLFARRGDGGSWRRLYPDLPGMGRSPAHPGVRNSDDIVGEILAFIDEHLPGASFTLAGESYGGYLAREILRRRPRSVDGLMLICPAVLPLKEDRELPPKRILVRLADPLPPGASAREAADFGDVTVQTPETWRRFEAEVLSGLRLADRAFLRTLRPGGYPLSGNPDRLEEPYDRPVLLLAGRQDHLTGYRDLWRIIENYSRGTFAVLDRAGHNLQIEQPSLFEALAGEWLDRVAESAGE